MSEFSLVPGQEVKSVALVSERVTRFRELGGSGRKGGGDGRIAQVLAPEIDSDLEKLHARARREMGYKRRDLTFDRSEPLHGRLRTPHFEYSVQAWVTDEPGEVRWSREVILPDAARGATDPRLLTLLGEDLDTVVVRFADAVDVAELIDRVEERNVPGVHIDYDMNCRWCELTLDGTPAKVRFEGTEMHLSRQPGTHLALKELLALADLHRFGAEPV